MPSYWPHTWDRLCRQLIYQLPAQEALQVLRLAFNFSGADSVDDFFSRTNQRGMWTTAVGFRENLGFLLAALSSFEHYPAVCELKTALGM